MKIVVIFVRVDVRFDWDDINGRLSPAEIVFTFFRFGFVIIFRLRHCLRVRLGVRLRVDLHRRDAGFKLSPSDSLASWLDNMITLTKHRTAHRRRMFSIWLGRTAANPNRGHIAQTTEFPFKRCKNCRNRLKNDKNVTEYVIKVISAKLT